MSASHSYAGYRSLQYKFWTREEDDTLLRLLRQGKTFQEIGVELDRPRQGCTGRWNKLRVRRTRMTKLAAYVQNRRGRYKRTPKHADQ